MSGFGSRHLLEKAGALYEGLEGEGLEGQRNKERRSINSALLFLYQQAKQISQIIAYIWRWSDDDEKLDTPFEADGKSYTKKNEVARELNTYFANPTEENQGDIASSDSITIVGNHLKKLFRACPNNPETIKEWKLLEAVFGPADISKKQGYIFPIFNEFELGESEDKSLGYLFLIDTNVFQGKIEDPEVNLPFLMKLTLAYPPRPQLGLQLTKQELDEWIKNRKKNEFIAKNPYIPSSST